MVPTFHLHCLGHRINYGNPEAVKNTKQTVPTRSRHNIYIYIASYTHSFWLLYLNSNVFSALHDAYFGIRKKILVELVNRLFYNTSIGVIFMADNIVNPFSFL